MSRSDLVERLLALCAIPSVTGDEGALADFIAQRGGRWPLRRVGQSLIFGGPTEAGRPLLVLFGHLDTVPPKGAHPAPRVEGERLYGLGASDMKGGLALMMALMDHAPAAPPPVDLAFVFYDREEGPYAESGLEQVIPATPWLKDAALAVFLEPTQNAAQLGCLGALHARLVFEGRAAHSARPWEGDNAIHKAGRLLSRLADLPPREVRVGELVYREVMSVTLAEGGRARNVVPDRFTLNLNARFGPDLTLAEAQARVRALVGGEAAIEFTDLCPSGPPFVDDPWVRRLCALTGRPPAPKQAWTDVARLARLGVPAVNCGPGRPDQAHQAGEFIDVARLDEGWALLRALIEGPPPHR